MSEQYGFFNSELINNEPDRVYEASDFANYFSTLIKNGVFANPSTNLQVQSTSGELRVVVKPGKAFVNGYWYTLSEDKVLLFDVNSTNQNSRYDAVILTLDLTLRTVALSVKKGTTASSLPAPILVRNASQYQMCLAQVAVPPASGTSISAAMIYDRRSNNSYCGWVTGTVSQINTTNLFAQYDNAFYTWWNEAKDTLNADDVFHLQAQIDVLNNNANKGIKIPYTLMSSVVHTVSDPTPTTRFKRLLLMSHNDVSNIQSWGNGIKGYITDTTYFTITQPGVYSVDLEFFETMIVNSVGVTSLKILLFKQNSSGGLSSVAQFNPPTGAFSIPYGSSTYTRPTGSFDKSSWFRSRAFFEVSDSDVSCKYILGLEATISGPSNRDLTITQYPTAYLTVEQIQRPPITNQTLIVFDYILKSEYNNLVETGAISDRTVYVVSEDQNPSQITLYLGTIQIGQGNNPTSALLSANTSMGIAGVATREDI